MNEQFIELFDVELVGGRRGRGRGGGRAGEGGGGGRVGGGGGMLDGGSGGSGVERRRESESSMTSGG